MNRPLVVSVILNTNRRQDTLACIGSLYENDYANQRIVVLDNASTDGSVAAVERQFPDVQIIPLSENRGYAGNNNVGITAALAQGAEWIFVLNEDTTLAPDCLSQMIDAAQGRSRVGVVGPMVYHHDEPQTIQSAGGRLDRYWVSHHVAENELDHGQFGAPRPVDWISGCAILVHRDVIRQVGALDERFFYYWEETEWCLRAARAGWETLHVPGAKLWHKGVQRDYRPNPSVTYYNTRNRFLVLAKHRAPLLAWLAAWAGTLRTIASWSVKPSWRHMRDHRDAMWQGAMDFLRGRWGMRPA
ncbi:MAG TPA: glycosyltransferase family 2 protein [Candidatus Binatia bacterium]|jgi:GT2 family glycosyltransferase|nr:glycosyltransferase family 2 protein [Candidatus Binatia bacterium]